MMERMEVVEESKLYNMVQMILKKVDEIFRNTCKELGEQGFAVSDYKKTGTKDKQGYKFKFTFQIMTRSGHVETHQCIVEVVSVHNRKDLFDVKIITDNNNQIDRKNVKANDPNALGKILKEAVQKYYKGDLMNIDGQEVEESENIKIKLKKITTSKDIELQLTSVQCQTKLTAGEVLSIIDDICNDDDFVSTVPENDDASYLIDNFSNEDEFEVNTCDNFEANMYEIINEMLDVIVRAENVAKFLNWNSDSTDDQTRYMLITEMLEDFTRCLVDMYRFRRKKTLASGCDDSFKLHIISEQLDCCSETDMCTELQNVYDILNLLYVDFDHSEQSRIDDMINRVKEEMMKLGSCPTDLCC